MTEDEVGAVVEQLITADTDGVIDPGQVQDAIGELAPEGSGEDDMNRVAARLAAVGWPLAHPSDA
ncbi:DUF3349 domain-containing protein [Nocardia sp. NPDC050630]|uniref:DUF3349 domain-containing protein n=1 Tax=Nocardia sp. NPDC050630 TaxID=3364321 RepID=UPI0037B77B6A